MSRRRGLDALDLVTVAFFLVAGLIFALPVHCQEAKPTGVDPTAQWHPCMDALRCVIHKDSTLAQKRETATSLYVLGSFAVVASNAIWQWDTDEGGYENTFMPSKQAVHFGAAFMLTQGAIALHVRPVWAVTITSVAGVGFELTQGHVNGYDIAADVTGSIAGALMARWLTFR